MSTSRRRWVGIAVAAALVGAALLTGVHALGLDDHGALAAVMQSRLPDDTLLYDRTGTVLLADVQQPYLRHSDVPLSAMGRWLPAAAVAVDDPGFWSEPGVDPGRLAGAAAGLGGTGSSIALRLVRLRLGNPDGVVARARAVALAVRIAAAFPKSAILAAYLNSLDYGNGSVGVEAASSTYFQVDAGQLDLAEAALIAGLPQAPAALDPLRHLGSARSRQREVLDAMVRSGAIAGTDADRAAAESLRIFGPTNVFAAPRFVEMALAALRDRYGSSILTHPGLSVRTTLDWGLQQQAEVAVRHAIAAGQTESVLAAIDPRTGEILAYAQATQEPDAHDLGTVPHNGTNAFRVFAYAAAITSRRYTMVTPLDDTPLTVNLAGPNEARYKVADSDLRSHGPCALRDCVGNGFNVPAVDLELGLGVAPVVMTARVLGLHPRDLAPPDSSAIYTEGPPDSFGLSLALGGFPVTPLEFTAGLAALADAGTAHAPNPLLRVTPARGPALAQPRSEPGPALDPGSAFVVSETLADAASRLAMFGPSTPLAFAGRHVAAVTGDTEGFVDSMAGGYTPSLAASLWAGTPRLPRPDAPLGTAHGMVSAAPDWHQFMQAALDQLGRGDEWYLPPAGVTAATVAGRPAWFLAGTSPATPAPALPANVVRGLP